MRIGVEFDEKTVKKILAILADRVGETIKINELLIELFTDKVKSSDYLFLVLSKLERDGYVEGKRGEVEITKLIDKDEKERILNEIKEEVEKNMKIFVTPLEVAKFFQCPRRLYLEKVVMSRQFKKERGKVWDGEALHLSVKMFLDNILRLPAEKLIDEVPRAALKKFEGKTTIDEKPIREFLRNMYQLFKEERFKYVFTERTIESIKSGLVGTPDIIAMKDTGDFIAMDVKLGEFDKRKGVKKEHLLQNVGETLLVEDFFRTNIHKMYLIYFQSNTVVEIDITKKLKKEFISLKRKLEETVTKGVIPPKSKLPNAENRVCKGCHVKPVCENLEMLFKIGRRRKLPLVW